MDLFDYDDAVRKDRLEVIAGVDEAGRGPLAGPVVAAAVILPKGLKITGIRDSKKVPEKEREELFRKILINADDMGVGVVDAVEIDRINILKATRLAMHEAITGLSKAPDTILIDALLVPSIKIHQKPIVKGDAKSASIAAASIIAKVVRDRIMEIYHELYPEYGFNMHKGYATAAHLDRIAEYGPSPIHRKSFRKVMSLPLPFGWQAG